MSADVLTQEAKKAVAVQVGGRLTKRHGKQRYYTVEQVKGALKDVSLDLHCWCYSLYLPEDAFNQVHEAMGQVCDYAAMRMSMVSAVTDGASEQWFDVDLSWLEWPDFDLSSVFDFLDF